MEKWIMLEVAVCVNTNLEDVSDVVYDLSVKVEGSEKVDVKSSSVENSYEFEC